MSYNILLKVDDHTHQQFQNIVEKLNAGHKESQAKPLGELLANVACEVIDQVFGDLLRKQSEQVSDDHGRKLAHDSEKVIHQILEAIKKYMPWAVSFFSNERLTPLAHYLETVVREKDGQYYVQYPVDNILIGEALGCVDQVRSGNTQYISPAFKALTRIVDQGVTTLIREPKKILKFNLIVDKTLNGVINLSTQVGYRRLEKLGSQIDPDTANSYIDHFLIFLEDETKIAS
nr:hypothetical protein [Acinetobacter sp. Marseille-Q1620]